MLSKKNNLNHSIKIHSTRWSAGTHRMINESITSFWQRHIGVIHWALCCKSYLCSRTDVLNSNRFETFRFYSLLDYEEQLQKQKAQIHPDSLIIVMIAGDGYRNGHLQLNVNTDLKTKPIHTKAHLSEFIKLTQKVCKLTIILNDLTCLDFRRETPCHSFSLL